MSSQEQSSVERNFPNVGRWLVTALPPGWIYVANFGIRRMTVDPTAVVANVALGQDELAEPDGLGAYVANQTQMIRHHLANPAIAGPQPTTFAGAEEAWLFFVRHTSQSGVSMLHVQTYVRLDRWVGIVTLTTDERQLHAVRPDYEAFQKGLRITEIPAQPG